jgi:hypothetical protein
MERLHLSDFCDFVGGEATNINPNHTAAAPIYRKPMPTILGTDGKETEASVRAKEERIALEDSWEARTNSWFFTRPWVCDIKEYNATIINTFLWVSFHCLVYYESRQLIVPFASLAGIRRYGISLLSRRILPRSL